MRATATIVLKGAAMGVAEIIPGVSGGTIALVVGIYDRLVAALAGLRPGPLRHVPRLHRREHRRALYDELVAMDVPFLIALGVGMAGMVIALARGIEAVLEAHPGPTYAFFAGLILASAVVLYGAVEVDTSRRVALALGFIAIAFVLSGAATAALGHALPVVFIAGAIAVTALVLPGVSGSFLLLALGQYEYMVGALNGFIDGIGGLLTGGGIDDLVEAAPPVVVFLAGAMLGLLTVAHLVSIALARAREATLIALISLMVGALRVPGEEVAASWQAEPTWIAVTVVAGLLGGAAILVFDHYTDDLEY